MPSTVWTFLTLAAQQGLDLVQAANLRSMYNDTRQEGFGEEMKRRILMGTYALSAGYYDAYYKKAQQVTALHVCLLQYFKLCRHDCHVQCRMVMNSMLCDLQVRTLVQQALNKALDQHDLLLSPVAPTTAFRIGEKTEDPLAMYKEDLMTVHLNLAGKLVCVLHSLTDLLMFGMLSFPQSVFRPCRTTRYQHTLW